MKNVKYKLIFFFGTLLSVSLCYGQNDTTIEVCGCIQSFDTLEVRRNFIEYGDIDAFDTFVTYYKTNEPLIGYGYALYMMYYHHIVDPRIDNVLILSLAFRYALNKVPMDEITVRKVLYLIVRKYTMSKKLPRYGSYQLVDLFVEGSLKHIGRSPYEYQLFEPDTAFAHYIAIQNNIENHYYWRLKKTELDRQIEKKKR